MNRPNLEQLEDRALLDRFHSGHPEALGVLLSRYEKPVFNFILRSVRDPQLAQDLVQETFARILQNSTGYQQRAKFSTWMYSIARNLCIDHSRRMRHRRHVSLEASHRGDQTGQLKEQLPGRDPSPDRTAAAPRVRERIAAAVEALPHEQREVFLMRQLQGMAFAEIAEVVDASESTVKSRMRYALERLQSALSEYRDQWGALG
ncbi:MAG: RNA polymerase sigma factor [Myxococcales bacterium]|nr:RNA polymerase sigma factor [Myxococcales bacterium]